MNENEWFSTDDAAKMISWITSYDEHVLQHLSRFRHDHFQNALLYYHKAKEFYSGSEKRPSDAAIVREVLRNPFKDLPKAIFKKCSSCGRRTGFKGFGCRECNFRSHNLVWFHTDIPTLAQKISEAGAFEDLPLLADMVEDCLSVEDFPELFSHLRGTQKIYATRMVACGSRCPNCDGPGRWRSGVGFEHEKICSRNECWTSWEPGQTQPVTRKVKLAEFHVKGCWALELLMGSY